MIDFEYWNKGINLLCGIDEVGRGTLAGPVVACALILKPKTNLEGIKDSKKLTPGKREELFNKILENSVSVGIGIVEPIVIDRVNILNATYEAMRRAIITLKVFPEFFIIDGFKLPFLPFSQKGIIKGDERSITIGATSIVAKVIRDRIMEMYDLIYPEYKFSNNKGYGTKEHIEAIKKFGPCEIHRKTFRPVSQIQRLQ
jgi:ribonuclease HII